MQDQKGGTADLNALVVECFHPRLLSQGECMFVGGANHKVHGREGHDLPKHHHVQLLSCECIGLVPLTAVIFPLKQPEASACTAAPLLEKLVQCLITSAALLPRR